MADKRRFKFDETRFRPQQKEAALALVEYEFAPKGERKSKQQIADELNITRKTLHTWDTQDDNFIAYKNWLSTDFMDTRMSFVYNKLLESIERGSVRGIELYMKRMGDLADQQELTIKQDGDQRTNEERLAELSQRLGVNLDGKDGNKDGE